MKTREDLLKYYGPHNPQDGEIIGWLQTANYDEIQQILKAPTQEQLDCPYCHNFGAEKASKHIFSDGEWVLRVNSASHSLIVKNTVDRSFCDYIDISYCPACGRKLRRQ